MQDPASPLGHASCGMQVHLDFTLDEPRAGSPGPWWEVAV